MRYSASEVCGLLRPLLSGNTRPFLNPLGIEIEWFVYGEDGSPVSLEGQEALFEAIKGLSSVWDAGNEVGRNMIEVALRPCMSLREFVKGMLRIFSFLAEDTVARNWRFLFEPSAKETIGWIRKPGYEAALEALGTEAARYGDPRNSAKVVRLARENMISYAAFQVNVGVGSYDPFAREVKRLLYFFSNWSPAIALYFESRDRLSTRRVPDAYGFAQRFRGDGYRDYRFWENVEDELLRVPQLIRDGECGSFRYDGRYPARLNELHLGKLFWDARPRAPYDPDRARVEVRSLGTMSPPLMVEAVRLYDFLTELILGEGNSRGLPTLSESEWWSIKRKEFGYAEIVRRLLDELGVFGADIFG